MEPWRPQSNEDDTSGPALVDEVKRRLVGWVRYLGWGRLLGAVGSSVVIIGLAWLLLRQPAPPVEDELVYATTSVPDDTNPSSRSIVTVHVAGRVSRPGVYDLPSTARVVDAIDIAGGAAFGADPDAINLAAPVSDGQRVYVPAVGEVVADVAPDGSGQASAPRFPIDINVATVADLDLLPGIGPATAAAIVRHRDERGRFASVDGLLDVPGIGAAKLDAIRGLVKV